MLEKLIEKRNFWTAEKILEANPNLPLENTDLYFTWEWDSNGVYFILKDFIEYTNIDTGECFSLRTVKEEVSSEEWDLYRRAYISSASTSSKLSKLEMAISREITTISGQTYEYVLTYIRGGPLSNKFQFLNIEDYFKTIVDDVFEYVKCLKDAVRDETNRYPYVMLSDRIKTENGYVWKRPRLNWNKSLNEIVKQLSDQFTAYVVYTRSQNFLEDDKVQTLLDYSKVKWEQLL